MAQFATNLIKPFIQFNHLVTARKINFTYTQHSDFLLCMKHLRKIFSRFYVNTYALHKVTPAKNAAAHPDQSSDPLLLGALESCREAQSHDQII